jgi:hypothetical protein
MSVVAKPLTYWASGLAVMELGCPDPKMLTKIKNGKATTQEITDFQQAAYDALPSLPRDGLSLMKLWDRAYRAHATVLKEKAVEGVDLHAELERFVRDQIEVPYSFKDIQENYDKKIWPFIEWSRANVKAFLWAEAHCYSEKHWIGGISDCGVILNDGRAGIIDFKSSKEAYLTQHWQCGGYAIQLEENGSLDAEGFHVDAAAYRPFSFTAIVPFGAKEILPHFNVDVEASKRNFLHCLAIHNAMPKP